MALAGLDYIVIDNEHGPFNPQSTLEYVRAASLYHTMPFARVQEISRPAILKLLDDGVMGLIIPCVRTMEEIEKIVEYGKYAPLGKRGVANAAGSGFWYEDYAQHGLPHYFEVSNRETMLIPQCETLECLAHIEEFVRVDGIDGIFVGPYDLSTAMDAEARLRHGIDNLPGDLSSAVDALCADGLMSQTLGTHAFERYVDGKKKEWDEYRKQVTNWETDRYMQASFL